ncbi:endonuclease/exonuclease/phosphatase family protein [Modestobacter sp. SSW1-42]|uniref:endonuclease/exonuclease/phosphatase family protein n=1 Tax=Modestobacter sp. SSW1-42 TaxID=596372 RepID=UPI003987CA80
MLRRLTPPPRPRWLRWSLGVLASYGALATLVLLAVAVLRDRTALTYGAALASSWWLAPAPLLVVAAAALRSWPVVTAVAVPAVVCAVLQGPYLLNRLPGDEPERDLRVATYNLTQTAPLDGLYDLIAREQPDVLLLQEVTDRSRPALEVLPGYPYRSFGTFIGEHVRDGDAVVSRLPITDVAPVTGLPEGARPTDLVTLDVGGRALAVLSVHLASPCIGCLPDKEAVNPAGGTSEAARLRVTEARRYADVAAGLIAAGRPVVLGGDLNSAPLNQPLGELRDAGLVDVHRAVGTWPALTRGPGPGVARVDAVLVSGLVPVRSVEGAAGPSTHSPMIADLAWPDG